MMMKWHLSRSHRRKNRIELLTHALTRKQYEVKENELTCAGIVLNILSLNWANDKPSNFGLLGTFMVDDRPPCTSAAS